MSKSGSRAARPAIGDSVVIPAQAGIHVGHTKKPASAGFFFTRAVRRHRCRDFAQNRRFDERCRVNGKR